MKYITFLNCNITFNIIYTLFIIMMGISITNHTQIHAKINMIYHTLQYVMGITYYNTQTCLFFKGTKILGNYILNF